MCLCPLTVSKCGICQRNHQCLFAYQIKTCYIPMTHLYVTGKCVSCVWKVIIIRYVEWPGTCHGNVIIVTRQTFGRFIQVQVFAK